MGDITFWKIKKFNSCITSIKIINLPEFIDTLGDNSKGHLNFIFDLDFKKFSGIPATLNDLTIVSFFIYFSEYINIFLNIFKYLYIFIPK